MDTNRRTALLCDLLHTLEALEDSCEVTAAALNVMGPATSAAATTAETRGAVPFRAWSHSRNDSNWFKIYTLQPSFIESGAWKELFRVSRTVFENLLCSLQDVLTKQETNFRPPLSTALRIAAFLMYVGGASCDNTGAQLGIGRSSVSRDVKIVSRAVCSHLRDKVRLPQTESNLAAVMQGFQEMRGLPYCVGAIDGTHIPWLMCPEEQYYEYRCCKGFSSMVLFAVVDANRRFRYTDIGRPGIFGDSTIYQNCTLKKMIDEGKWLGQEIPDLVIAGVDVRPYLIGDCAFRLDVSMMKSSSEQEMAANPVLKTWDAIASQTRKPVECAFGILKHRFSVLKTGLKLHHEDDMLQLISACVSLHNLCMECEDHEDYYLPADELGDPQEVTVETISGKKQRDALLYYVVEKLGGIV